jgi:hypothetical protein
MNGILELIQNPNISNLTHLDDDVDDDDDDNNNNNNNNNVGRDSSVGIVTRYALDGQGIELRRGRDSPPSRPALAPIQPSV